MNNTKFDLRHFDLRCLFWNQMQRKSRITVLPIARVSIFLLTSQSRRVPWFQYHSQTPISVTSYELFEQFWMFTPVKIAWYEPNDMPTSSGTFLIDYYEVGVV